MPRGQRSFAFRVSAALIILAMIPSLAAAQKSLFAIDDYFKVLSLSVADMTRDGEWLAGTLSTPDDRLPQDNFRYGDPTYIAPSRADVVILNTKAGTQTRLFPAKQQVRSLKWSPDGSMLAMFVMDKGGFRLLIWHRNTGKFEAADFSQRGPIASNSDLEWSPDGNKLYLSLRSPDWEKKSAEMFKSVTDRPIIAFDSDKPFLPWDEVQRRSRLRNVAAWDRPQKKLVEILPETPILSLRLTRDSSCLIFERDVTEKTSYDEIGGTSNQLEILKLGEPKPRVLLEKYERRRYLWTRDNTRFAYTDKDDLYVMGIDDKEPRCLTKDTEKAEEAGKKDDKTKDQEKKKKQTFDPMRFSPDGSKIFCSSTPPPPDDKKNENAPPQPLQYWLIDAKSGQKELVTEIKEAPEKRPTLSLVDWSPDGGFLYLSTSAQDRWERGLVRLDLKKRQFQSLVQSGHLFGRWTMAETGSLFVFTDSDGDLPDDWHAAGPDFQDIRRLTDLNPWLKDKVVTHSELISYRDADGKELKGVLYYPANYEKGKIYPLITEVYEKFFDNGFNSNFNIYASAGYAVLRPSVNFITGYPGEAWAKAALSAVNKIIEMGVADPDRLGIQGTSYGGYATVLLITQTDRFKAAINNSGKVNMVSFYTQSPRLGVRNTHAPEKSQDRLGGTLWEYPERYLAHSAILSADRIKTPLMCITGDQDPNVEALQSQEIFYALRRLGKKAVWLRYHGGAHGGPNSNEERRDMFKRMLEWYDTYLKAEKK